MKRTVHSLTVDRGTEFSRLDVFEDHSGVKAYYCHARSPTERSRNEYFSQILRYFYPKGTCFEHISVQKLSTTLLAINQRPFKILNWQTPYQVLLNNAANHLD
ncbi:IS30 family transposase [Lactiplantibacillus plantarum]|uniref:IS30 family transposase n=1 Tax=Lactiplantibacillus plantarum TaxID=1590 RepID=UPI0035CF0FA0|nr:IS30 family transposase [Lactiplantibacillus plantarum]MCT3271867.1 IS30 family transposase [Lactiplantibacillus plantarum]